MKALISSKKFHSLLGMAISAVILIWLFARMNWALVLDAFWKVNFWPFIPALLLFIIHLLLRSWRWRFLIPDAEELPIRSLFDCLVIGNLASYVLPFRAGEFIRPYLLTRGSSIPFSVTFTSIVIERFFDLSLVLISFALMICYVPELPPIIYQGAYALSLLAAAILIFMLVGSFMPEPVMWLSSKILSPLPQNLQNRLEHFMRGLLNGGAVLRQPKRMAAIVILSLCIWFSIYIFYQALIALFSIEGSLWIGVAIGVITALAVAAPSAPGFIGVYQAGCVAALLLFGVSEEVAVAFSILTHAFQFVLIAAIGFYTLMRNNLSFADLKRSQASVE